MPATDHPDPPSPRSRRLRAAAFLLGVGFGGLFDGILLHQVLQWHHLLSGLQGEVYGDLRVQVMADGLFHALMYLIASAGVVQLARSGEGLRAPGAARVLVVGFLYGFGAWHVADSVLSHWLSGIHRIRMDVPNPLFWDLLWFALFGIVPLVAGFVLRRGTLPSQGWPATTAAWLLVGAAVLAGAIAARPADAASSGVVVVLRPGAPAGPLLAALARSDTRILWSDPSGAVWAFQPGDGFDTIDLYRRGAMYVSGGLVPAGCAAWVADTRTATGAR